MSHTALPAKNTFAKAAAPTRWDWAVAAVLLTACLLLFAHPDILETANHSWLFLDHVFGGNVGSFYTDVLAHQNDFYYVNAAHYNIFLYAVFGIWLLPVYGAAALMGAVPGPLFLSLWCKALACIFAVGCGALCTRLAAKLGADRAGAAWAGLGFLLSPFTVFAAFTMGQYDSICLFFMLLALCFYLDGRLWQFAFVMGLAITCKMFALLMFLPLLVLKEKRFWRMAGLALLSLWLYLPTTLAFAGRDGDMGVFNDLMVQRLFAARIPGGIADLPLFLCLLAAVCAVCWLYRPAEKAAADRAAVWVPLAVLTVLFVFIYWHPQWLILLAPFAVLSTRQLRVRHFWAWLDILAAAGFFLLCYVSFPGQLEVNLLAGGILQPLGLAGGAGAQTLAFYFGLLPYVQQLAPVLFCAPLLCGAVLKLPWRGVTLADRLTGPAGAGGESAFFTGPRFAVWGVFWAGYGGCFLLPCLFQWLKCVK